LYLKALEKAKQKNGWLGNSSKSNDED